MTVFGYGRAVVVALAMVAGVGQESVGAQETLTFEKAQAAMNAAEAEARQNGWRLTIVVADSAGVPIYLRRLPGAAAFSYQIAMAKVRTALTSGMHTGDYARAVAEGRVQPIQGGTTFEGGFLIRIDGRVVGAMSASGARAGDDAAAVRAGLAAIGVQP